MLHAIHSTNDLHQLFQVAVQHHQANQLKEAESLYRHILTADPRHADALHLLGVIADQVGKNDIAIHLIQQAIAIAPDHAHFHSNHGVSCQAAGLIEQAIGSYRKAIALDANYAEAHYNLGTCLSQVGQLDEAITAYRQSISIKPNYAKAHNRLGHALQEIGQLEQAAIALRAAIDHNPDFGEAYNHLACVMTHLGRIDEAIFYYRQAVKHNPEIPHFVINLGSALKEAGLMDEAIAVWRRVDTSPPMSQHCLSNLIYTLHFHHAYDAKRIAEDHRLWNQQFAEPLKKFILPHTNNRDPERRLRIGYVSPNFWAQAESYFVVPLFEGHDQSQYEIHAYATWNKTDAVTERHRRSVSGWHDVSGMSDEQLAAQIRQDGIDILVDLTMHMAHSNLTLFARKPAPIQVTWLAYPGSTGLETMDYRITDAWMDPPACHTDGYSEESIRLPDSWCCFDPMSDLPPVPVVPDHRGQFIRFGCFNNICKLNEPLLSIWAELLAAVPQSRLMLLAPVGDTRVRLTKFFTQRGIDATRIEFVASCKREEYLRRYNQIDISLDPLPYNGITTTLDSLWMGVPVVSLAGKTAAGRASLSLLSTLGLPELAKETIAEYLPMVINLANDLPRLAQLRSSLREMLAKSPLMDARRFAHDMESAYRKIWQIWCK